jgi:hypothetical protein
MMSTMWVEVARMSAPVFLHANNSKKAIAHSTFVGKSVWRGIPRVSRVGSLAV